MTVGVCIHWTFRAASTLDLFEVGDLLTAALLELERSTPGLLDSAVSVDRGQGTVEIEVTSSGQSEDEAVTVGQAAVQSAIAMTGGERMSMLPTGLETTRMALA